MNQRGHAHLGAVLVSVAVAAVLIFWKDTILGIEPQIRAFGEGILLSNLYQWTKYWYAHPEEGWKAYWKMGLPHALSNIAIDALVLVAWSNEWLDSLVALVAPGSTANTGVPYSPQIGVVLGFFTDILADQIAFVFMKWLKSRAPVEGGKP